MTNRKLKNISTKIKIKGKSIKFSDFINFTDFMPFPLILTDKHGKICYYNSSFNSSLRNKNRDVINIPVFSFISKEHKEKLQGAMNQVFENSGFKQERVKITGLNTPLKLTDILIFRLNYTERNSFLGCCFYGYQQNETAESGITSLNIRTKKILEIGNIGLWELNIKRNLFRGNEQVYKVLGFKCPSLVTEFSKVKDIITKLDDKEVLDKNIKRLIKDNEAFEVDFRILTDNKEKRTVKLVADKLTGGIIGGTITDITEKRKMDRELIRSKEKAEKADYFKSSFLTNLSHELRTPMNAILGFTELLNQESPEKHLRAEYTSIIKRKANYLLSLIDDINELAKFETGQIKVNKTLFPVLQIMKEIYIEFDNKRIKEGKTNIRIEMSMPEGIHELNIYTDQGRLQQVLSNLLSNALKYTEKGVIEFGLKISDKNLRFFVNDTGIGMSEDEQKNIFKRFNKIEENSPEKYGKYGFSLTISRHIVEMLGGKIKVKSEINNGSLFQFDIPVETPEKEDESLIYEIDDLKNINWKNKIILIAEDEDVNYKFLESVLHKTQIQLLRAVNGQEAVALCKKIPQIDIVLMDIKMPVMNGFEAITEIRKFRKDLPVIAQTAFSSQDEINKCLETGCIDYVTKPIDIKLLIQKINTYT